MSSLKLANSKFDMFRINYGKSLTNARFSAAWCGRLAQMDRALVSGIKGRGFESRIAHQFLSSNRKDPIHLE